MSQAQIITLVARIKQLAERAGGVDHDFAVALNAFADTITLQAELLTRATDRLTRLEAWAVSNGYTPPSTTETSGE